MPTDYVGQAVADPGAWQVAHAYSVGNFRRPIAQNGLYYKVTSISGSGTSGGSQPSFPLVIGATVTDNPGANQVVWTCWGDLPGFGIAPIITESSGTDADSPQAQATPLNMIADWLYFINFNAGYLSQVNTWLQTQAFDGGSSTTPAIQWPTDPTSQVRVLVAEWAVGNVTGTVIYGRLYADSSGLGSNAGLVYTVNANWNGTHWAYDVSTKAATMLVQDSYKFILLTHPSGGSAWNNAVSAGNWVNAMTVDSFGGTLSVTALQTYLLGGISGIPLAGNYGPNVTAAEQVLTAVAGGLSTTLQTTPPNTGMYRIDIYVEITTGTDVPVVNLNWDSVSGGNISSLGNAMQPLLTSAGTGVVKCYTYTATVWCQPGGSQIEAQVSTSTSHFNWAATVTAIA